MQFTAKDGESHEKLWELILHNIQLNMRQEISAATSSFFKTADGLECNLRKANGTLIGTCYSESDRMGNRRWTISLTEK